MHKSWKCAQNILYKAGKAKTSKMHLNFTADSFIFGCKVQENAPRTFSVTLRGENFQDVSKLHSKPLRFWTHISWYSTQNFFLSTLQVENIQNASELHSKQLRFWTHKSWNCTHNFLLQTLQAENVRNASEPNDKHLHFWTKKSRKCVQNFFVNLARQRTSKMCLNFTANRLVIGRTISEIAPRTFSVKLAGRELPKCVWTSRQIPSFLDYKIEKMRPELFF